MKALAVVLLLGAAALAAACRDGGGSADSPTWTPTSVPTIAQTLTPVPYPTPPLTVGNPCVGVVTDKERDPLVATLDAHHTWTMCFGGAAAGSLQKVLFFSSDGGATWRMVAQAFQDIRAPLDVGVVPRLGGASALVFSSPSNGWLGLTGFDDRNFWRSEDGGRSWYEVKIGSFDASVERIQFTDAQHGQVDFEDSSYVTENGGRHWYKLLSAEPFVSEHPCLEIGLMETQTRERFALDDTHAWLACQGQPSTCSSMVPKGLLFSSDGGTSWRLIASNNWWVRVPDGIGTIPSTGLVGRIMFRNAHDGWLTLHGGCVVKPLQRTRDGGRNWEPVDLGEGEDLIGSVGLPVFTDELNGRVSSPYAEWATENGGDTWIKIARKTPAPASTWTPTPTSTPPYAR